MENNNDREENHNDRAVFRRLQLLRLRGPGYLVQVIAPYLVRRDLIVCLFLVAKKSSSSPPPSPPW